MGEHRDRSRDEQLTEALDCAELYVSDLGTDSDHNPDVYHAWSNNPVAVPCPRCGSEYSKTHKLMQKNYVDVIRPRGMTYRPYRPITLQYHFHKYRCTVCGKTFANPVGFAPPEGRVTYRAENMIVDWLVHEKSYGQVVQNFGHGLGKQTVCDILSRWVARKAAAVRLQVRADTLAVFSGITDQTSFTAVITVAPQELRVVDLLYGVSSDAIALSLKRMDLRQFHYVLTDFSVFNLQTVQRLLPDAVCIIPAEFWIDLLLEDFREFLDDRLRWNATKNLRTMIVDSLMAPSPYTADIRAALSRKPDALMLYDRLKNLTAIIRDRDVLWIYEELAQWRDALQALLSNPAAWEVPPGEAFIRHLQTSLAQLDLFRQELTNHAEHPEAVPKQLHPQFQVLAGLIRDQRTISDDLLKARAFYTIPAVQNNWAGIRINELSRHLEELHPKENQL